MEKRGERPTPQEHEDFDIKNSEKECFKPKSKKRNAHFYKMLFKKQRLCSEKGCGDQTDKENKIQSGSSEFKLSSPKFEEYWVPVHLSSLQIEQYCSILSSNSDTLSSLPRKSSLNDIITQIQKCCDHPYLADPTLRNSVKEASLTDDRLAAEINVSGKLRVLDKLLLEIKRCGLKALVLFQSAFNSEKISTGHILDDLVHQRFGENSYAYIPENKKDSLKTFNNTDSERFVCLFDYHACHTSIKLSRVDVVIIFNSDRNPSNDINALTKITIDSPREPINVFRLYTTFTVEEKALILTKQGSVIENYINSSICHQLLAWGAPYLFSKLENQTETETETEPESFIDDLVHELSSLLRNTSVKTGLTGPTGRCIVSNARMQNGGYSEGIKLFGETESYTKESASVVEYLVANSPCDFWSNLVKESQLGPKKSSIMSFRRGKTLNRNCDEGLNAATTPSFVRSKQRSKRKYLKNIGRKRAVCENATPSNISDSVTLNPETNVGQQSQTDQPPPHALEPETERIQTEREQIAKSHQEKECEIATPSSVHDSIASNPVTIGGQQSQIEQPPPHTLEIEVERIRKERDQLAKSHQEKEREIATPSSVHDSIASNPVTIGGQQSQTEQPPPHTLEIEVERIRKEREQLAKSHEEKECEIATPSSIHDSIASNPVTIGGQQSQTEQPPPHTLEIEVERIRKERAQLAKSHQEKECEIATPSSIHDSIASNPVTIGGQQSQTEQPPPHILEIEIERIRKEREQLAKSHQEKESKLLAECEKEISEVQKRYDGLIRDSKTRSKNEDIILENYQQLVNANKLLAEILAQNSQATPSLKRPHKETSALKILTIPASGLGQPRSPCLTSDPATLRLPAPHLRSSPSLFSSLHNRVNSSQPSPTLSTTQTVDKQLSV